MSGEIEVDESYFGARRVRVKRGRGAGKKTPVFGMLKRNGCVYTQVVKHCSAKELLPRTFQSLNKVRFTVMVSNLTMVWWIFCFVTLATLQEGAKTHYRVKHSKNEFANGRNHINEIVNF